MASVALPIWLKVFERDKGLCQYCGGNLLENLGVFSSATMDHLIPRMPGEADDPNNLVAACPACNCKLSRSTLRTLRERKDWLDDYNANRIPNVHKQYSDFQAKAKLGWPQPN